MIPSPIDVYRRQIEKELQAGNATEHTHRPALKTLIESLAPGVTATNEPKHRTDCGAPDLVISRKAAHGPVTLGHIEAKDVGKDLDEAEKSEQMKRYLPALPNLILTDYLEFRWYVEGEHRQTARLARVGKGGKLAPEKNGAEAITDLLTAFLSREAEPINDPKTLALRMARLTHFIRDMIVAAFAGKVASATLRDLHGAFEKALIPDLPMPQFADMFAQTLAYGLFAARCNHHGPQGSFKRLGAASEIPKTNPFLRQLFETITGTELDEEPYAGFVDDLAQLLADTDIGAVLADFGKRTARQDPVVHFYETFLAAYDPKLRESRGVYYTPEPVVSYIVRSVDYLLKTRFGCANGLADTATVEYEREEESSAAVPAAGKPKGQRDAGATTKATSPRVLILDPACGTGTFLYTVIDHIRAEFMRQENAGMWSGYVRNHLLPRIFGFELLMAPYAVAHFKLAMQLAGHDLTPAQREKWAYDFSGDERLGVFLTNTLEEAERRAQMEFGFLRTLTEEANATVRIKRELPIMVVVGNPPYSNFGRMNRGKWILGLLNDYKKDLHEKKLNLDDDFIKFIRFGQWRIDRTGAGILAFISNNTYIDGITHRRMRQSLMESFSDIYILDLHGSSVKKEKSPDGSKDENVFDIQQGVSIGIFVKEPNKHGRARVRHSDLWGLREWKYTRLFETDLSSTKWVPLEPEASFFFFVPKSSRGRNEYEAYTRLRDIFREGTSAVQTKRDALFVDFDKHALMQRMSEVLGAGPKQEVMDKYPLQASGGWSPSCLDGAHYSPRAVRPYLYRPFDVRHIYYKDRLLGRSRIAVFHHLVKPNLSLATLRQTVDDTFRHVFCTRHICDINLVIGHHVSDRVFPLYLYPADDCGNQGQSQLEVKAGAWPSGKDGRRPNLDPAFVADLEKRLGLSFAPDGKGDLKMTLGPEDVFNYIYAVFHSPTYRTRYAEFLKSDFPRVPLTSDLNLFRELCAKGAELVALHLLESPKLEKPIARYPVKGPDFVDKGFPKYVAPGEPEPGTGKPLKEGRVYINVAQRSLSSVAALPPRRALGGAENARAAGKAAGLESEPCATGQYFECVPPEVWNFHIGGYQVCEKWLKDRRGRSLTYDDLEHYCKVVTALSETIRLMAEIDVAIPKWPME